MAAPTDDERVAMYRAIVIANVAQRGERFGVAVSRRHLGVLGSLAPLVRSPLFAEATLAGTLAVLGAGREGHGIESTKSDVSARWSLPP